MDKISSDLLEKIADLHSVPQGAFNLRENGVGVNRRCTEEIIIENKRGGKGINIKIKANTKNKSVHIPVIITKSGIKDKVLNDFYVGDNCDVLIVAGCGIHNSGTLNSEHNGLHRFFIGKNCTVKYVEKHLGMGTGADKILNPSTKIVLEENSVLNLETTQIGGVSSAVRKTFATVKENSVLNITERILTQDNQTAKSIFTVNLLGQNSRVEVDSKVVARNNSKQYFMSKVYGKNLCFGHVSCDGIVTDNAEIISLPAIYAKNPQASLVHEAAIGKIAGEQIIKLQTLGLSQERAEEEIIQGFMNYAFLVD